MKLLTFWTMVPGGLVQGSIHPREPLKGCLESFGVQPSEEVTNMAALVIINAMVFQERLAQTRPDINPVNACSRKTVSIRQIRLLQAWDYILRIDYYPIFKMARDVKLGSSPAWNLHRLDCRSAHLTAEKLLGMGAVGRQ